MKTCSRCGVTGSLEDFNKDSRTKDGKRSECRVCHSTDVKKYRLTTRGRANSVAAKIRYNKGESGIEAHSGGQIEGHHPDYAKPLEVLWVCSPCHKAIHA